MATTAGHEYLRQLDLSVEHLWYNVGLRGGVVGGGAKFSDVVLALGQDGQCSDAMWPYDPVSAKPAPNPLPTPTYLAGSSRSQPAILDAIRWELISRRPTVVGIRVNDDFVSGVSPIDASAADTSDNGLHAVLAIGFDDARAVVAVRNSWGPSWGNKGYAELTFGFVGRRSTRLLSVGL
jgi:Papain family cysteine protease